MGASVNIWVALVISISFNGPLTIYVKLGVAHAPGNAVMHVGIANPRWRGKRSRHSGACATPILRIWQEAHASNHSKCWEKYSPTIIFVSGDRRASIFFCIDVSSNHILVKYTSIGALYLNIACNLCNISIITEFSAYRCSKAKFTKMALTKETYCPFYGICISTRSTHPATAPKQPL